VAIMTLSSNECDEILKYFRAELPDVDDELLQELASNHALETLACFDSVDFHAILSVPGPKVVLRGQIQSDRTENISWTSLFPEWSANGMDLAKVTSALLVVRTAAKRPFPIFSILVNFLESELQPAALLGGPIYRDKSLHDETSALLLVLSGAGTAQEG